MEIACIFDEEKHTVSGTTHVFIVATSNKLVVINSYLLLIVFSYSFQIKVNPYQHNCPSVNRSQRMRAAKRRWIADVAMSWIRHSPGIGPKEIQQKLLEKYGVEPQKNMG